MDFGTFIEDSMEPYDGKDVNLVTESVCASCFKKETQGKKLMQCSRCHLVSYCSRDCQKEHFSRHKKPCKRIKVLEEKVEREAQKLRSISLLGSEDHENLFETQVGRFWGLFGTRDYMVSRVQLADATYDIAYELETQYAWEKALFHYLELLRLDSSDNLGVRNKVAFILLNLNRDDDAYSFMRYWINWPDESEAERERRHLYSRKGEWMYPIEEGCRYLDIFKDSPNTTPDRMPLPFLVATCIIKLRIVAAYDAKKKSLESFSKTQCAQRIEEVGSFISEMVTGDNKERDRIESQRNQLERLLFQIHENNSSMLPSIINPMPFKSQPLPSALTDGSPAEAYFVLNDCNRCFIRVPGATELLERRFGKNPSYNSEIDSNFYL